MTNAQIRRGASRTVPVLEKDIRTRIAAWNADLKPCVGTHTADEILERLASCLHGVLDSED
ncbi:hypothetical protein ACFVP3_33290 [Streptomyces sp. NPDC057806]|uniref:hypothetical protein n=1 Tax=unclassified Streptomyces TaxID=2593676 RepID=UPI0036C41770